MNGFIIFLSLYKCYASAVGLDKSLSPSSLLWYWLGHLPSPASPDSFTGSKVFIECYMNIIKSVEYIKVCQIKYIYYANIHSLDRS